MKVKLILLSVIVLSFSATYVSAQSPESSGGQQVAEGTKAVEVGNKICPVSREKVDEMGAPVKYEYKGKIYNFCCAGCVAMFKEDPEKYVKIVEEQMGHAAQMESDDGHEGHHHVMGEMDEHMMMASETKGAAPVVKEEMTPEVKEIDIEAYKFGYSPDRIVVKKGDTVKIHATSRDVPHGILIKEYGINERVEKGKVTDIEFVADKTGTFDIRCSVYCGAGHRNMKAQLVVE